MLSLTEAIPEEMLGGGSSSPPLPRPTGYPGAGADAEDPPHGGRGGPDARQRKLAVDTPIAQGAIATSQTQDKPPAETTAHGRPGLMTSYGP